MIWIEISLTSLDFPSNFLRTSEVSLVVELFEFFSISPFIIILSIAFLLKADGENVGLKSENKNDVIKLEKIISVTN